MNNLPKTIIVDGVEYVRVSSPAELLTIAQVRPIYGKSACLDLRFTEMPKTKFRPGMKVRIIIEDNF